MMVQVKESIILGRLQIWHVGRIQEIFLVCVIDHLIYNSPQLWNLWNLSQLYYDYTFDFCVRMIKPLGRQEINQKLLFQSDGINQEQHYYYYQIVSYQPWINKRTLTTLIILIFRHNFIFKMINQNPLTLEGLRLNQVSIYQHFTINRNQSNLNQFHIICKHCQHSATVNSQNTKKCLVSANREMYKHILKNHDDVAKVIKKAHCFEPSKVFEFKKILLSYYDKYYHRSKYDLLEDFETNHEREDQWIDKLVVEGYSIEEILRSFSIRYQEDQGQSIGKYLIKRSRAVVSAINAAPYFIRRKLPKVMLPSQMSPLVMQRFRVTEQGSMLLIKQFSYLYLPVEELIDKFNQKSTIVRKKQNTQNRNLECIFFTEDKMKDNYNRYGDVVMIHFKDTMLRGKKSQVVILFGQNNSSQPCLFAFCLINEQVKQNYIYLLEQFIEEMQIDGHSLHFVIEECPPFIQAINRMNTYQKYLKNPIRYVIRWDTIEDKISDICDRKKLQKQHFGKLIKFIMATPAQAQSTFHQDQLKSYGTITNSLLKIANNYRKEWRSHKQPFFIYPQEEKNAYLTMKSIVRRNYLKQMQTEGFFFLFVFRMCENFYKKARITISYQEFQKFKVNLTEELHSLGNTMQKDIFKKLLKNIEHSGSLIPRYMNDECYEVNIQFIEKVKTDQMEQQIKYQVNYSLANQRWQCSCHEIYWNGLPCRHIIRVVYLNQGSLTYYIHSKWLTEEKKDENQYFYEDRQSDSESEVEYYDPQDYHDEYDAEFLIDEDNDDRF